MKQKYIVEVAVTAEKLYTKKDIAAHVRAALERHFGPKKKVRVRKVDKD